MTLSPTMTSLKNKQGDDNMDILKEPFLKDQIAKAGLLSNPVFMGIVNNVQKCRDDIIKHFGNTQSAMVLAPFIMLETGYAPLDEKFVKMQSIVKNGWSPYHQAIMLYRYMQQYMHDNNIKAVNPMDCLKMRPDLFDERVLTAINNFANMYDFKNPLQVCNMLVPIPRNGCDYMRLSTKARDYVMSLGIPSKEVLLDFYESLEKKAELNGGMYEAVVQLTINNRATFIYYSYCFDGFTAIRYGATEMDNEFCWDHKWNPQEMERTLDSDMGCDDILEVRGLLANIWASIVTKSFEVDSEPSENRKYIDKLVPVQKANYSSYRYVKITPDCEEKYNESQRVINMARSDATYRKSMWFTRAYYAHRGPDKVITFCKASIHHRKCGDVVDSTEVTVLV